MTNENTNSKITLDNLSGKLIDGYVFTRIGSNDHVAFRLDSDGNVIGDYGVCVTLTREPDYDDEPTPKYTGWVCYAEDGVNAGNSSESDDDLEALIETLIAEANRADENE